MRAIEELNKKTIGLLKSTQVISSLSSIVKECIENSLDAGASVIVVKLDNFGFKTLEIKDNGSGISETDISYVAKPHYTSKLRCFEDLGTLSTYGFRGEAISSLCTISDVIIKTKTAESCMGHTYQFDHQGNILAKAPLATNLGTNIIVNSLFKNLPVRKQFYSSIKSRKEELKKVEELVMSYAIIKPNLHISFLHNKQIIYVKPAYDKIEQSFYGIFQDAAKKLSCVNQESDEFKIQMWLPNKAYMNDISCSKSSIDRLFLFVNNRPVNHKNMEKLIKAYYSSKHSTGSHGKFPVGVLCIEVPSDSVDVNLEPNKNRVIFKDEASVLNSIETLLSELYGVVEPKDAPRANNSCNKVADFLPCTMAGISQEDSEDHTSNIKNLNIANKCSLGPKKKNDRTNIVTSTPNSNLESLELDTSSLSTILGSNLRVNSLPPPNNKLRFEKQNGASKNSFNSSSIFSKEKNMQNYKKLIDNDSVIPKILNGCSVSVNGQDKNICNNEKVTVTESNHESFEKINVNDPINSAKCHSNGIRSNIKYNNKDIKNLDLLEDLFDSSLNNEKNIDFNICRPSKSLAKCNNNTNGDLLSKENSMSIGDDCWSRGHILLENRSIQNVEILTRPYSLIENDKLNMVKCPKRNLDEISCPRKVASKKAKNDVSNDSLSLPTTPIRKVESAFSLYAKEIKKEVLDENLGADLTIVAQEIATRWKNADSETKNYYEKKSKVDYQPYIMNQRSASKLFKKGLTYPLDRFIAPVTPEILKGKNKSLLSNSRQESIKPISTKLLTYSGTFEDIKSKIHSRKKLIKSSSKECLIGGLKGINGWVYKIDNQICSFNSSRLNEIIIFSSLIDSFCVPSPDLMPSITIDDRYLNENEWKVLVHLSKTGERSCDGNILLTDKRVLANGFRILLFKDSDELITRGQVIGMVDAISNYGIQDLKFILNILSKNSELQLKETRPQHLQEWIKGEAIRMSKVAPHFRDKTTVMKKLTLWNQLTGNCDKDIAECLHGKLIFTPLISLDSNCISVN